MKIYRNTVSDVLWEVLSTLMSLDALKPFRLVGGTSLSFLLGHRISMDIDMFTDAEYDSLDFEAIHQQICRTFKYVEPGFGENVGMGTSYFIGNHKDEVVKVDLYYTEAFLFDPLEYNGIRLSRPEEIIAMKLEIVGYNGRKKDFWDLHELMEKFSWKEMLEFFARRYPFGHSREKIISKLIDFIEADSDPDPICLKGKYWELIKLDIEESLNREFRMQIET